MAGSQAPPQSERGRFGTVLGCFFLSGLAALIYQTAWTRQFALVFGTSELAVATVLAAYMGGLGGGAALAGRLAPSLRRPVAVYGLLEAAIALSALLGVPAGLRAAEATYVWAFGSQRALPAEGGLQAALFMAAASTAILLVPTALMGATLPLLARHAVRHEQEIGSRIGLLYALNTLGAVVGALLAGFVLLPRLGLAGSLAAAAAVNAAVFLAALALVRAPAPASERGAQRSRSASAGPRWILPAMLASGAVSFTYEVLWTRLLGQLLGGTVEAFATMLASFLSGIALGSLAAARLATHPKRAARGFAAAQVGVAACSLAAFVCLDALPALAAWVGAREGPALPIDALLAASILLPSTVCIGATFPFAVRIRALEARDAPAASGEVYGWNTGGAILGALGSGFLWIPLLGFEGTVRGAALVSLGLALWAQRIGRSSRAVRWAAVAGVVLLGFVQLSPPWHLLRTSPLSRMPADGAVVHYGVGRSATVLLLGRGDGWQLRSNGLPEATILPPGARPGSAPVAGWLGVLPTLARPQARSMLVVGLGGGVALERVPAAIESIDVVELEPEVVRANRAVASRRARDPLADPRVRLVANDARGALLLTGRRYDAIVSQPSHPWTAGASHLYTREFFELVRSRLEPGGVLVQWIGLAFVDEALLRTLVATLTDAFGHVEIYRPARPGLLFLASDRPLDLDRTATAALAGSAGTLAELGILDGTDLVAARCLDARGARAFAEGAAVNSDDRNLLGMRGLRVLRQRALFEPDPAFAPHDPVTREARVARAIPLIQRLLARRLLRRAERVAKGVPEGSERDLALGLVAWARGQRSRAAVLLKRAADQAPDSPAAFWAWTAFRDPGLRRTDPETAARLAHLRPVDSALLEAWAEAEREDWASVRARDALLGELGPADPAFPAATRLRIRWRLHLAGPEEAQRALVLADRLGSVVGARVPELLMRARAAVRAGLGEGAITTLGEVADRLGTGTPATREAARQALAVLDSVQVPGREDPQRLQVERWLRQLASKTGGAG